MHMGWVEVQRSAILVYIDEQNPVRVIRAELDKNGEWLKLLDQVSKRPKASIIFLMREDAMSMYYAARTVALSKGARNGKLPVIGQGKIDLSLFKGL